MQRRSLLKNLGLLSSGLAFSNDIIAQKSFPNKSVRIAHITDTHIQQLIGAAKGFEKCLHHIQALKAQPDFIINGGDAIIGMHGASEHSIDKQWSLFHKVLKSENSLPIYNCLGNHDIFRKNDSQKGFIDEKMNALDQLSIPKSYYCIQTIAWKIIVLDSIHFKEGGKGYQGKIDEEEWHWLQMQLENTDPNKHIMIVSRIPILSACVFLDGKNFKNGEWRVPETWMHGDAENLIELFAKHKNIKLAISGHIHLTDQITYNKVSYNCNGAVSGNWWMGNYKQTSPGYAVIDLFDEGSFENKYLSYA